VRSVLEGSIRRSGNRVRITAQLIDAASGGHLWAERYDRDLTDLFAVQDDVTRRIVDALKVTLSVPKRRGWPTAKPVMSKLTIILCVAASSCTGKTRTVKSSNKRKISSQGRSNSIARIRARQYRQAA
jgi:hypothetical protein